MHNKVIHATYFGNITQRVVATQPYFCFHYFFTLVSCVKRRLSKVFKTEFIGAIACMLTFTSWLAFNAADTVGAGLLDSEGTCTALELLQLPVLDKTLIEDLIQSEGEEGYVDMDGFKSIVEELVEVSFIKKKFIVDLKAYPSSIELIVFLFTSKDTRRLSFACR